MNLKIMLPAIKYPFIQSGMLFSDSKGENLYVMTGELLLSPNEQSSNELFNQLRKSNIVRIANYGSNDADIFERFGIKSLSKLVELDFYLVSCDGELTEIKR